MTVNSGVIGIRNLSLWSTFGKKDLQLAPFTAFSHCACHFLSPSSFTLEAIVDIGILSYTYVPSFSSWAVYACMYACMYVCIYVCMYVCVYIYIYLYVYIMWHLNDIISFDFDGSFSSLYAYLCQCKIHILTYSMVQIPSWEANWFAASQEIPRISWNPKVHNRTHKRPPPVPILGQPNPVHISTSHLLEIQPNIIHPSTPRSPQWSLSLRFPPPIPYTTPLLTHTRHMPCPSHSSRFYHPHNIGWGLQIT